MRQPAVEELVARTRNRYLAVAIVMLRARQLIAGDMPVIDTAARSPVTVALEELAQGRLRAEIREGHSRLGREDVFGAAGREEAA
ncbi:MAG TPA: DNA-directed RNA polymerase subunit omega [bacterium]|nr:DNA-directed RNA polymerase subunit omega [bacterium]